MKIKLGLFATLLCFSLSLMSTAAAQATNAKTPTYEDIWWAQNPTLMQFIQNQTKQLKTLAVMAATDYASLRQEAQNYTGSWRIENPTLHESGTIQAPSTSATSRAGDSRGFRMYGENPTL